MEQKYGKTDLADADVSAGGVNVRIVVKEGRERNARGISNGNASITGGDYMNSVTILANNAKAKKLLMKRCLVKQITLH